MSWRDVTGAGPEPVGAHKEPFHPPDSVFYPDPETAEAAVILVLSGCEPAVLRFLIGKAEVGVHPVMALVRAVATNMDGLSKQGSSARAFGSFTRAANEANSFFPRSPVPGRLSAEPTPRNSG